MGTFAKAWQAFNDDKAQRLAAAIAYSTIFSIAPLFVILIAIVGNVLDAGGGHGGHAAAETALLEKIRSGAGAAAEQTVRDLVEASFSKPRQGLIASAIAWVAFVLGAGGLFAALQDALNAVWRVETTRGGWRRIVRDRVAAFGMIVVVGFLLLVTFVANAALAFASAHTIGLAWLSRFPLASNALGQLLNLIVSGVVFAAIFKVLPDVEIEWHDVRRGAAVTALLFSLGEVAISLYFTFAGVASAYGAAGSLLVALIWIYYSALIMLFGAEFTKVSAGRVRLAVPATVREHRERPAGADPRVTVAHEVERATTAER